jgi:hypothetical protein
MRSALGKWLLKTGPLLISMLPKGGICASALCGKRQQMKAMTMAVILMVP